MATSTSRGCFNSRPRRTYLGGTYAQRDLLSLLRHAHAVLDQRNIPHFSPAISWEDWTDLMKGTSS